MNLASPTAPRSPTRHNTYDLHAERFSVLIGGAETGERFSIVELHLRRSFEPPVHVHQREDEMVAVLEGELDVRLGENTFGARPGEVLWLPRGVPHALRLRSETARLLVGYSPAGFERYLCELARPAIWPLPELPTTPGPPDVPRLVTVGDRYGITFYPPLPEED